ncbi:MAG: class I SAM-dependent methyltransferase [Thermodesulfobacteriota bacterium]|nr:class I SAM-dependent methyltransferase [Thermodesulfobacteriota bacterium]
MKTFRQKYYDAFSRCYDQFVAFHSTDRQETLRALLAGHVEAKNGGKVLDLCTGTGSTLSHLQKRVGRDGLVVGIDFSTGMLLKAQPKIQGFSQVRLVKGDAATVPFKASVFDAVTCSYAFYELKGKTQEESLREIVRVLKPGKPFLMMEHDLPRKRLTRILFYVRLLSMGLKKTLEILRHEGDLLRHYFSRVDKVTMPGGRTKIMVCIPAKS